MGKYGGWQAQPRRVEHGGPKKTVKVNNVLADKMIKLSIMSRLPPLIEVFIFSFAVVQATGNVANGRVKPDVEIFIRVARNFKAEVGRIPADIPILQAGVYPLIQFVSDGGLQTAAASPFLKQALKMGQLKKQMVRAFLDGYRP